MGDDEHVAQGTGEPMQEAPVGSMIESEEHNPAFDAKKPDVAQDRSGPADDGAGEEINKELRSMFADKRADPVDDD
jgi:hypothetical protein